MFEIKTPDGFICVKQLCCRIEYWRGFSYEIEMLSIIQDGEGNRYIREYSNRCDSGANGRPETTVKDYGYKTVKRARISRVNERDWKKHISPEESLNPSLVFESTSGAYVDQDVLDFVRYAKATDP